MKNFCIPSFLLGLFIIILFSCKKEKQTSAEILVANKWIESNKKADTLYFKESLMFLNREKEITPSGYLIPKIGAGLYFYKLKSDSIALMNGVSSSNIFNRYTYKVEGNKLFIDDFYEKTANKLVFEILKD